MAVTRWIPLVTMVILGVSSIAFTGVESMDIPDLRRARNHGTNGRFIVPRPLLEDQLERLGLRGRVQLLSSVWYNSESDGEVLVILQTTADITLPQLDDVTTDGTFVSITMPVVASDGGHSVIMLAYFTDAPRPFVSPYLTSVQAVHHVDSIEVGDGFVTLSDGSDVMIIEAFHDRDCADDDTHVGSDFDYVTGKDVRISNFPAAFDWGCDSIGRDVSFCRTLEPFMDAINNANGHVCTEMSTSKSRRCHADMSVVAMTGVFRDAAPFFDEMVPVDSFEAEWIDREHGIGIVFPCF